MNLIYFVNTIFNFYFILILFRIVLSWVPNLDWFKQPLTTLSLLTDWYLNLFKKIIPPMGGIDFSPILAIIVLGIIQRIVLYIIGVYSFA